MRILHVYTKYEDTYNPAKNSPSSFILTSASTKALVESTTSASSKALVDATTSVYSTTSIKTSVPDILIILTIFTLILAFICGVFASIVNRIKNMMPLNAW